MGFKKKIIIYGFRHENVDYRYKLYVQLKVESCENSKKKLWMLCMGVINELD